MDETREQTLLALIRDLHDEHRRVEPHHEDMCELCRRVRALETNEVTHGRP